MITPQQIRGARAMLGLKQTELAEMAQVSLATLNNIEREVGTPRPATLLALKAALEKQGIEFLNGTGVKQK